MSVQPHLIPGGASVLIELPPETVEVIIAEVTQRVLAQLGEQGEGRGGWLSVKAAAEHMGCSEERVRKLIARRKIPHYSEGPGCRITLKRSEIDSYLEAFRR